MTGRLNHRISNQVRVRQTAGGDCFREAVVLSETTSFPSNQPSSFGASILFNCKRTSLFSQTDEAEHDNQTVDWRVYYTV